MSIVFHDHSLIPKKQKNKKTKAKTTQDVILPQPKPATISSTIVKNIGFVYRVKS
jgi:hypothetical protein